MVDIKSAGGRVNDALKRHSVDKAGFWVTETETQEFNVEGGEFTLFRTLFDNGLNLTVYHQNKKGSITTNKLDDVSIDSAVEGLLPLQNRELRMRHMILHPYRRNSAFMTTAMSRIWNASLNEPGN